MLILTESDVRSLVPMPDLIEAMARALAAFSAGQVNQPVRTVLEVGPDRAFFGVMPAALDTEGVLGAKLVTVYERNHDRGLPSHLATVLLLDHETGAPAALLDGRYITEARTAAVSAVSVRHLSNPEAGVLGIVGSGVQARSHLEAIRHVRRLRDVRVWSPTPARRDEAVADMRRTSGLDVRAVGSAADAVRGADLVVLATSSRVPVVAATDIAAGSHIVGVGACRPDQREMPTALVARSRFFVDARTGALRESGDLLIPIAEGALTDAHIAAELGDVVAGRARGRTRGDEVTIFKSLGMAVEDLVAADLAVGRARDRGVGREVSLA